MALELVGITKRFGAQVALDRVSLRVEDGDCYGFIGHNGAGKTTAMRIALGLQRPDSGRVLVEGFDARAHPREARARMGGLIEVPGFQGAWSGTKNLTELARLQGMSRADARREAHAWVERVGLADAGEKHVVNYSQGMRQRLGIAQALLGSPRYVLLDEPTNGLDPEGIAEMRALIQSLRDGGQTLLVSSHQLHELSTICNRVGVLRGGKLLLQGTTADLLQKGGARWRLETNDAAAAERALAEMGIQRSLTPPGNDGRAIWIDLGGHPSAEVTRALVQRGVDVVSFSASDTSLEEIYLRFAHGAPGAPATATSPSIEVATPAPAAPRERLAPPRPVPRMAAFDLRRYVGSIGLLLLLATPAVLAVLRVLHRRSQATANQAEIEAGKLFSSTSVNAFEALGLALQAGLPLLAFLVLGLASQSLAAEYARGTLRNVLLRPLRRIECALGKGLALVVITYAGYALLLAVSFGIIALWFRFTDLAEVLPNGQRFLLTPASALWAPMRHALVAPLPALAAYAGLGFLAGSVARTGAGALALALGLGVFLDLARALTRSFGMSGALPSDHLPSPLSDTSFLSYYVDLVTGVSNVRFEHPVAAVIVPLAWALGAFALAALILEKRAIP